MGVLRNLVIACAAAVFIAACASPPIPNGYYTNKATNSELLVRGSKIEFRVPTHNELVRRASGTYNYHLRPDGWLRLYGPADDSYFHWVVSESLWYWNGSAFEMKNKRDGTVVTYAHAPQ